MTDLVLERKWNPKSHIPINICQTYVFTDGSYVKKNPLILACLIALVKINFYSKSQFLFPDLTDYVSKKSVF